MPKDLTISLVQTDLYWENTDANLAAIEEKLWSRLSTDLVILPEMFTTGFSMRPAHLAEPARTKTYKWMLQQAAQLKAVVAGSYIVNDQGRFYNRLYVVFPDGESIYYDKRHLFGLAGEDNDYSAGKERLTFELKGWRIMPLICYDLRFPVWSRSQKKTGELYEYDLLFYVANWPEPRITAWDTLLSARAIENVAYCAGVNRIGEDGSETFYLGHSAIYDYKGDRQCFSKKDEVITHQLSWDSLQNFRQRFPFQADADDFTLN